MNTPNKLTMLRMILVPFFLLFLLVESIPLHNVWALLVFAAAAVTDALDGHIARSRGLITDFGKFLDPVADKVLTFSALIAFVELGCASAVAVVIMMAREFLVSSLRMVAAGKLGKLKTVVTMVSIVIILLLLMAADFGMLSILFPLPEIGRGLVWLSAVITVISGTEYLWVNRAQFTASK